MTFNYKFKASLSLASAAALVLSIGVFAWITSTIRKWRLSNDLKSGIREVENHAHNVTTKTPLERLENFDWKATSPRKFRPFKPIYHITMALQSDTPSDLITIDKDYLERINLRKSLIKNHGQTVHGYIPSGQDAVQELYSYLMSEYLPTRYPTLFKLPENSSIVKNQVTRDEYSVEPPIDTLAALRAVGTSVEEDIFILKPTPDGHQCVAFMCCFPSGWNPASKLGKHMNAIHTTVPAYGKIGPSMERFFTKLKVGESVKRVNWTIQTHKSLYNTKGNHIHGEYEADPEEHIDAEKAFVRCELQTLSRLPKSHSILFSFKTYLYPLKEIKAEGMGSELADAIESLKKGNCPGMWKYKSAVRWGKPVCEYLRGA
ncbi:hypothetical protein CGLO_17036 [Colletotrichum gloeosporioides Cg-14]|uniref:Uncharacterized protein n=1 Tax=Colletotrichum gloeosporioides (strain Cg-14) TaxID=1237896 RepID=T0JM24_COLGC|nr:hypothetical protein CGLO_17036 [Colletotrichum gloeosporioides Cg-14]